MTRLESGPQAAPLDPIERDLVEQTESLVAAGRGLVRPGVELAELHRFRLRVKRLRYALEMLRDRGRASVEPLLAEVKGLQDCLGEINDCEVAARLVERSKAGDGAAAVRFREFLARRREKALETFYRRWADFDAPGRAEKRSAAVAGHIISP